MGFPRERIPNGFAIPFYFYDEFMKTHGFYDDVKNMLADEKFQADFEVQEDRLDDLRDDIKDAQTPQWMIDALTAMHAMFPEETSLRYRSSTNNEDLPGLNGAGLYDSKTQHPEETVEDGISKSLKQVFASLWTFRAFTEREFHRIDYLSAAMGVLVHPNFSDELANGVGVSFNLLTGENSRYYVNTQLGENLVTNPEAHAVPEEILLERDTDDYNVLATSNLVDAGQLLMSAAQLVQLRDSLTIIHDHFKRLYSPAPGEPFAMDIEFKITSENILSIKQARPWVFSTVPSSPPEEICAVSSVTDDHTLERFVECAAGNIEGSGSFEETLRFLDEFRDGEGNWNDGSTYLVLLTAGGGVYFHADEREAEDLDWSGIISCEGGGSVLDREEGCFIEYNGERRGYAHPFSASHVPLTHGENEFVLLGGFDEFPDARPFTGVTEGPSTKAGDVDTDEELREFVEDAGRVFRRAVENETDPSELRGILRREGPWRAGDVYIYIMDESGRVIFDGGPVSLKRGGSGVAENRLRGGAVFFDVFLLLSITGSRTVDRK